MAEDSPKPPDDPRTPEPAAAPADPAAAAGDEVPRDRPERGISDLVRRAVSAGFEAASRSKEDVVRIATGELRTWLDRLDLDSEIVKALSKMTVEVKAEIRFRATEDGRLVPEATTGDMKIKPPAPKG